MFDILKLALLLKFHDIPHYLHKLLYNEYFKEMEVIPVSLVLYKYTNYIYVNSMTITCIVVIYCKYKMVIYFDNNCI